MSIPDQDNPVKKRGRPRGVPNKATLRRQREVERSGLTPLEYMLRVMRNPKSQEHRRDSMAIAAAPYIHPKLATLQSNVNLTGRLTLEQLITASMPQMLGANEDEAVQVEDNTTAMIDVTPKSTE